jgi:phage/plasmid-like protein (TIGR03299 family)
MSADIDITAGEASFVSANLPAWHALGTVLDHTFTAEEAMTVGKLGGWRVRKTPLQTIDRDKVIPVPERYAVVRDNPVIAGQVDVIGSVGETYSIVQNEEHAALLNTLVDESGAHFETAGALNGGSKVFIAMKMPGHLQIGGVDKVENYIAAVNSHDGSSSFTLMVTPVRIVCSNTLNMAFSNNSHMFRVRHTSGADKILIQQARETLDMTFKFLEGFQKQAEQLINTSMTQVQFEELIEREFGAKEDAASATVTRTVAKISEMARLFGDASTQEGIRNTAWAGLNALTEWSDHYSPTRGATPDIARHQKAIFDPAFKNQALAAILKFSGTDKKVAAPRKKASVI